MAAKAIDQETRGWARGGACDRAGRVARVDVRSQEETDLQIHLKLDFWPPDWDTKSLVFKQPSDRDFVVTALTN